MLFSSVYGVVHCANLLIYSFPPYCFTQYVLLYTIYVCSVSWAILLAVSQFAPNNFCTMAAVSMKFDVLATIAQIQFSRSYFNSFPVMSMLV